jgi:hypothetical protein
MSELNNDIKVLRKLITDYYNQFYDDSHRAVKTDINSVQIAVNLAEIYYNYRNLSEEEQHWFKGERFISELFINEWQEIADTYKRISIEVKKERVRS